MPIQCRGSRRFFESIGSAQVISTLDLAKGYWQIPLTPEAREKTAFVTPSGLYEFGVLQFGLHSAPATFQRMMDHILRDCRTFAEAYIDDVVIYSNSWEEHVAHLKDVFARLKQAGLTLKLAKFKFVQESTPYLGHIIGGGEIKPDPKKIHAIEEYALPETKKDIWSFLGLVEYCRRFIPNSSTVAAPLTDFTKKRMPNKVAWTDRGLEAFKKLKQAFLQSNVLKVADPHTPFILQTDASEHGLGVVLSQRDDAELEHPVAYASRKLLPRERNYSTVEKECLAIVWALRCFHTYLFGGSTLPSRQIISHSLGCTG